MTNAHLKGKMENYELLKDAALCYSDEVEGLLNRIEAMKNNDILRQHPYAIAQHSDGRFRTYIPDDSKESGRRLIAKSSLESIHKTIISEYRKRKEQSDLRKLNLENLYERWLIWRRDTGTDPNTIKKNISDWNRFIKDDLLSQHKISNILTFDIEEFFLRITKGHSITFKQLSNVRTVLSGTFNHAVRIGAIEHSVIFDIDYRQFQTRCKPENSKKKAYTDNERKAILLYLEDKADPYSLAISFAFRLMLRIGELQVLKKLDVNKHILIVERSIRRHQKLNDDFSYSPVEYKIDDRNKGNTDVGRREVTLSPKAQRTAQKAIELNPDGEYLFMNNGKPIMEKGFNNYLKRTCEALDIPYRSSHQIRFTTATNLAEAGIPINQLSYELGHSDVKTTFDYIRQRKMDKKFKSIITQVQDI